MKLFAWVKSLFPRRANTGTGTDASTNIPTSTANSHGLVPFLDIPSGRVVRIPAAELRPGCVQIQLQGSDEVVWAVPEELKQGEIRHPPFEEEIRDCIRRIQSAFAEHYDLSLDEWEDGFRRDANPAREIALWSHAANVYQRFTTGEASADHRAEVYNVIVACMTTSPDAVWHVVKLRTLTRPDAERIVNRFYGKADATESGAEHSPDAGV
jgi:hypothetical protein